MKSKIEALTRKLLESALSRDTEQGVFVYREALKSLDESRSDEEEILVLKYINKSLAGIEAHGFLTPKEYFWVKELRELENVRPLNDRESRDINR